MATASPQPNLADLTRCDREPIHIPSLIQPHGLLLALDPQTLRVAQVSANAAAVFDLPLEGVLGAGLDELIAADACPRMLEKLADPSLERNPTNLGVCRARGGDGRALRAVAHRSDGIPVLELEFGEGGDAVGFSDLYATVQTFIAQLHSATTREALLKLASQEVREITAFDRVLIYQFDAQWNGTVIAESGNGVLPSYLDLRFPASDIPRQARELYRLNRLRLIADAGYTPVALAPRLHPASGAPLDMSFCTLRSVSPVHVEYMRNMGTASSMSISILRGGDLWGLISCHSAAPRRVGFEVRAACDFLAQVLSLELSARERAEEAEERVRLKGLEGRLLGRMAGAERFDAGLAEGREEFLKLTDATGGAVVTPDETRLIGETPTAAQVRELTAWLAQTIRDDVFATHELPARYPPARAYKETAAGLLSLSISELHPSFVLWFRPEVVRTVKWAGDPVKPVREGSDRLHPRQSFELWKQEVADQSLPWSGPQLQAAADLRKTVVGIVLRQAEELAELSHELELSNRDLEAFSYSVSHDLRAPFRHIVGYAELLRELESDGLSERGRRYIDTIIESAQYAGTLVDHLLQFSRMSRTALEKVPVDLARLVREVRLRLGRDSANAGRAVEWRVGELPTVRADLLMLRLVVENLLSNAMKYTRTRNPAQIEVGCEEEPRRWVIHVRDNGVGFDMMYVGKLFGVFQRLHRMEDFEGTGIGLANVRRIVTRHGGEVWAEAEVDRGATFYFSLPKQTPGEHDRG